MEDKVNLSHFCKKSTCQERVNCEFYWNWVNFAEKERITHEEYVSSCETYNQTVGAGKISRF